MYPKIWKMCFSIPYFMRPKNKSVQPKVQFRDPNWKQEFIFTTYSSAMLTFRNTSSFILLALINLVLNPLSNSVSSKEVPTTFDNYQIRSSRGWCNSGYPLTGLDDPNCVKLFPQYCAFKIQSVISFFFSKKKWLKITKFRRRTHILKRTVLRSWIQMPEQLGR